METSIPLKLDIMVKPLMVLVLFLSVTTGQSHSNVQSDSPDAISVLQHTVTELSRQMEGLKQLRTQEMETVANLQETLSYDQVENKHLKARVAVLESRLAADIHNTNGEEQKGGLPGYSNGKHLSEIKTNITTTASTNRNAVAFYSFLTHNVPDPGDDFTIKNDHPITNLGGGYNPASGIFTCQKAGVYVFSWSIGLGTNGQVYSELTTNGAPIGYLWTGEHTWAETSEKTVILELRQGDVITIRVARTGGTSPTLWGLRTSFSGYLIPY